MVEGLISCQSKDKGKPMELRDVMNLLVLAYMNGMDMSGATDWIHQLDSNEVITNSMWLSAVAIGDDDLNN